MLASCNGPTVRADGPAAIRISYSGALDTLDPVVNNVQHQLFLAIFDALTETRADGSLGPRLAVSWQSNPDATVWSFALRPDARFQDGAPVTANDVAFTFNTIATTPTSLNKPHLSAMVSVEAVDAHTVRFTLNRPFASWPRQVALLPIVPQASYRRLGPQAFSERPVGSGPYRVIGFRRGEWLKLAANPAYWGGAPDFPQVEYIHVADDLARYNGLLSGSLDVIDLVPQQVRLARRQPDISVVTTQGNQGIYLGFNTQTPVLANIALRHAMDLAIDRAAICRYLMQGLAQPIGQLVAPATFGYDPAIRASPYDPVRAKRLVERSGYAGQPIILQYSTGGGAVPLSGQLGQAIGGYLSAVGLNIDMRGVDEATLASDWQLKRMRGIFLFSYHPSTMDASLVTGRLVGFKSLSYFDDPAISHLDAAQEAEQDDRRRRATFTQIWRINQQKAYYLPLLSNDYSYAYRRSLVEFEPRADGYVIAQELRRPDRRLRSDRRVVADMAE
jgi:peptide/nickel transport system substrate-binding protein